MLKDKDFELRGFHKHSVSPGSEGWYRYHPTNPLRYIIITDADDVTQLPIIGKRTMVTYYGPEGKYGVDDPMFAIIVVPTGSHAECQAGVEQNTIHALDAVIDFMVKVMMA